MSIGQVGSGSSIYSTAQSRPFGREPIFEKPSDETRDAKLFKQQRSSRSPNSRGLSSVSQTISFNSRLNESNSQINSSRNSINIRGSSFATAEKGAVTIGNGDDKSLTIKNGQTIQVFKNRDSNALEIINSENDERVSFKSSESLTISGDGRLNVSGSTNRIEFSDGNTIRLESSGDQITLQNTATAERITLSDSENNIEISDTPSQQNAQFALKNDQGRSILFNAGENGTIQRETDSITITNSSTKKSVTFNKDFAIRAGGNVSATISNQNSAGELTIKPEDQTRLSETEDGELSLVNESTIASTQIDEPEVRSEFERPLQIKVFEDSQLNQLRTLTMTLLSNQNNSKLFRTNSNQSGINTSENTDINSLQNKFTKESLGNRFKTQDESASESRFQFIA